MIRRGHTVGTAPLEARDGARHSGHAPDCSSERLFGLHEAARYLNLSYWTVRDMVATGAIPRVRLPLNGARDLRRVLVDRADLDRLIAASKGD